ncbi:CBS domain-containing protein [Peptostreptococcus porci]|uniref:CBS domain-containing protein n=2 Tax=Peptostreptococcus porci TaxID=2652282 RepID=UPI0023F02C03|nr:CBS domain-containing protein [Peptostreptococcus porci]MDD7182810.1 CBS domain-containing protein [Peptostreptococcus porci]MDY2793906.1 CBS domain-containing protein [Peptostreptococcus porci]MDY4560870.1 CBS domain-containing protein [Peptostreptococcus porci]MDY5436463.1 CBS domain-containing protein [Peptostreptococcus porci]MDY5479550.1 CBS domain-containing protein [Peptostreptococcus porci]
MNILFFLTPKSEVVHVLDTDEIREVLRKLKSHKFSSIPILNKDGNYLGTVKEGDLLWFLESAQTFSDTVLNTNIMEIPRRLTNETVKVDTNVEDLFTALISQNFVPVIDDSNIFIGIIKRRDVLSYACMRLKEE